jgi:hypothetical protein
LIEAYLDKAAPEIPVLATASKYPVKLEKSSSKCPVKLAEIVDEARSRQHILEADIVFAAKLLPYCRV